MKKVVAFVHIVDHMNMWVAKVTAFLIIPIAIILLYGVILRYVFSRPVAWEGETAWLLFIGLSLLGGAYVLREGLHVRLDALYGRLSPRRKAIMDVATFVFFLLFIGTMTWLTINKAIWSLSIMEKSTHSSFHAPIYLARTCLALSSILLLLQGIVEFIDNIMSIKGHKIEGRVK